MLNRLKNLWQSIPTVFRKPVVLIIGLSMVIASPLLGWLPGPGGIPLFLLGVTILATEFKWADRLRRQTLKLIEPLFAYVRAHRIAGTLLIIAVIAGFISSGYYLYGLMLK